MDGFIRKRHLLLILRFPDSLSLSGSAQGRDILIRSHEASMILKSKNGGFIVYVECPECGLVHGSNDDTTMEGAREAETLLLKRPICSDCVSPPVASIVQGFSGG